MASNRYKPTSSGTRVQTPASFEAIPTKQRPGKTLGKGTRKGKTGSLNGRDRIKSRFISATKRKYREIDEKLQKRRDAILGDMQRMIVSMIPESTVPLPVQVLQARRNAEARENLLQEFGAMTSSDIGDAAGSKASNRAALAHKWKSDGRIFSVVHGNVTYFPGFQFTPEGRPLQVISEILAILGKIRKEWELALWFTGSNGWLRGARPVDLLLEAPARVVEAARREAEDRVF